MLEFWNKGLLTSSRYELSADKKYLLCSQLRQTIYPDTEVSQYYAVDLQTKEEYIISGNGSNPDFLYLAEWSPVGNGIAFVIRNNLYYKPSVLADAVQLTTDGSPLVLNGIFDWVYKEEIFETKKAFWFSPDGQQLAFVRLNDSDVHLIRIPAYGPVPSTPEFQYPQLFSLRYPKVNTPNPVSTLYSVLLTDVRIGQQATLHQMLVPEALHNQDHLITAVGWQNNETFVSTWMNRVQNTAYLQACTGTSCRQLKTISSSTGWVDLFKTLYFSGDGNHMLITMSQEQESHGSYRHLTLVSMANGTEIPLTTGTNVVQEILNWNTATNQIFFSLNSAKNPHQKNIYSVKAVAGSAMQCLTCNISLSGVHQTYFHAEFSKTGNNLILTDMGPSIPRVNLYTINTNNDNKSVLNHVFEFETNIELRSSLELVAMPKINYLTVNLSSGFEAKVKLTLPPNVDLSGSTKYPMLVDVYAGPDFYNGYDFYEVKWGDYLASNKSVIYAQINGRGSGLRGDKLLHALYHKFGLVEVHDQIETVTKLREKLPFIDGKRVAIWGWSYGGFVAAMALAKDNSSVFQCAASVAPVTDWIYYDSIYTERYMGLPTESDNLSGYLSARLTTMTEHFRNKKLFLIHGTMDDNVHYQQSMALARNLETHDILFEQLSYPDNRHSLGFVHRHLYHSLGRYFAKCFGMHEDL